MQSRVVIVDDHASFRRLAKLMLGEGGFDVVGEAVDAASALTTVRHLQPDLVLLDVVLPDRSGLFVARELAEWDVHPLVVLTSSRSRADFGSAFEWPPGCQFVPKHDLSAAVLMGFLRRA